MTKGVSRIAALSAFAAAIALPALSIARDEAPKNEKGEAELAEILKGRIAGEPVKCLNASQRDRLQIVDRTAFIFRDGRTLYVNRTASPRFIDDFDVPVFKPFGSSLCRLDQVEFRSRTGMMGGPVVTLGEFVPYTKVEEES